MGTCKFCGTKDNCISSVLQICRGCILGQDWNIVKAHVLSIHKQVRKLEELPEAAPQAESNIKLKCNFCLNECSLSENDVSYCGLRNIQRNAEAIAQTGNLKKLAKLRNKVFNKYATKK